MPLPVAPSPAFGSSAASDDAVGPDRTTTFAFRTSNHYYVDVGLDIMLFDGAYWRNRPRGGGTMVASNRKRSGSDERTLRVEVTAREAVLPCPVCRARGVGTDDGSNVHLGGALHRTREYPLIPRGAIDRDSRTSASSAGATRGTNSRSVSRFAKGRRTFSRPGSRATMRRIRACAPNADWRMQQRRQAHKRPDRTARRWPLS